VGRRRPRAGAGVSRRAQVTVAIARRCVAVSYIGRTTTMRAWDRRWCAAFARDGRVSAVSEHTNACPRAWLPGTRGCGRRGRARRREMRRESRLRPARTQRRVSPALCDRQRDVALLW